MLSGPGLQLRAMSVSVALPHLESVLMCMTPDIKGHADARGLGRHLGPCWYQEGTREKKADVCFTSA